VLGAKDSSPVQGDNALSGLFLDEPGFLPGVDRIPLAVASLNELLCAL
jgi:hypothetical protein